MSDQSTPKMSHPGAVELKSGSITLPILKVLSPDLDAVTLQLEDKLGKAPEFFRNAPIIIDLGDLEESEKDRVDFTALLKVLHQLALAPVGMRGGSQDQQAAAQREKLVHWPGSRAISTPGSTVPIFRHS